VPHRSLTPPNGLGDLGNRCTLLHQRLQFFPRKSAPSDVLVAVRGPQSMFLDPIANGRFMQVKASPDLGQREPLAQ
jgi:hypothetical protein